MLAGKKRSLSTDSDVTVLHKEWDEALCPICIEHPHNAVLLLCSSHGKGCRPYICDTSYRHSNCLDRYRKLHMDSDLSPDILVMTEQQAPGNTSAPRYNDSHNEDMEIAETNFSVAKTGILNLKCPLCRGDVQGWKVIEEARTYLNMKTRSCSRESCSFLGNYRELRRHARSLHPSVRPTEVDPSRQQAWSHFEHQREYDDIVSAIHSAIPGAVMFGDYVVEDENNDDMIPTERERTSRELNGSLWTTLFLLQMIGSIETTDRPRGTWSRHRRSPGRQSSVRHSSSRRSSGQHSSSRRSSGQHSSSQRSSGRRNLRGENRYSTRYESDVNDEDLNVRNDDFPAHRRRRRLTRTRYTRDQH